MIKFHNQKHVSTMLKPLLSIASTIDLEEMADYQILKEKSDDEVFEHITKEFHKYLKEVLKENKLNKE